MLDKVRELLAKQLRVDINTITADTEIIKDLNADSLDIVELLMSIEQDLGIVVPDEDVQSFKTVGDVAKYLESKK